MRSKTYQTYEAKPGLFVTNSRLLRCLPFRGVHLWKFCCTTSFWACKWKKKERKDWALINCGIPNPDHGAIYSGSSPKWRRYGMECSDSRHAHWRFPQIALIGREIRSHKKRIGICSKLKELKQKSVLVRKRRIGEASLCLRTYSGVANGEARPKGENSWYLEYKRQ